MVMKMKKILAICAHPNLSGNNSRGDIKQSFANNIIINELARYPNITIHNIGEEYPDYQIDIDKEQSLLIQHDYIFLIGPIYWYSLPAIAKQWIDEVLLYGWAYGSNGKKLSGKQIQLVLTSGSDLSEYTSQDIGSSLEELFSPYLRTFEYCKMIWRPIRFAGNINTSTLNTQKDKLKESLIIFTQDLITQLKANLDTTPK